MRAIGFRLARIKQRLFNVAHCPDLGTQLIVERLTQAPLHPLLCGRKA